MALARWWSATQMATLVPGRHATTGSSAVGNVNGSREYVA